MAAVSDTTTFDLVEVLTIVATSLDTLDDAIYEASVTFPQGCWDSNYSGSKDSLYNFRNYDNGFNSNFDSFLTVALGYISGNDIDLYIENTSFDRTTSATIYWEARLAGTPVDDGSVSVVSLPGYIGTNAIDLIDYWDQQTYDEIYAKVDSGPWVQIA